MNTAANWPAWYSRAYVASRWASWVFVILHGALMFAAVSGGAKEGFVWVFVFVDFPISVPAYIVFDMLLGLYHSNPMLLWFIYLAIGSAWQFFWPRGLVGWMRPR